jgi:hypothetical protein
MSCVVRMVRTWFIRGLGNTIGSSQRDRIEEKTRSIAVSRPSTGIVSIVDSSTCHQ